MRDIVLTAIIFGSIPFILRRPWIGIMMWVWVSLMSPHRLTWSFAYDLQFALIIAVATVLGIVFSKERYKLPVCGVTVTLIVMLIWMSVTTVFAIHPESAVGQWEKVMKIQIMNLLLLYVLSSRMHMQIMVWVIVASIGFYGTKGGLFTILSGGGERVYGPSGSFIEENNSLALATVMTIPLIYYLVGQVKERWMKLGLIGASILCGFSALGSHSRGGFLAIGAMVVFLWMKSRRKLVPLFVLVLLVPVMIGFMPDKWMERMESITEYEEDSSAQGRLNAWMMAINLVKDRPIVGGGFDLYSPYTFGLWAPNPANVHSSHSIYFQMLGEHGFPGLFLFLLLLALTWKTAGGVIRRAKGHRDLMWVSDLCRMIQVSLVGYITGGAFLNLGYFDLPYYLIALVVLSRFFVERELAAKVVGPPKTKAGGLVERQTAVSKSTQTV